MSTGPLLIDVSGPRLDPVDRARLRHPLVGGVILFTRNFESRRQIAALIQSIRAAREAPLLITVDHEGGRVQRFRDGFTEIPPMRTLGELWDRDPLAACTEATRLGRLMAAELRAIDVDLSFTPVLDLDHGRSQVIGHRAFHGDPRVVTILVQAFTHGLLIEGMAHCGKHFPGHGWAEADSHHALPVDERPLETILAADAAPYGWLRESLAAVMPAHIRYTQVDDRPAGFSSVWLRDVLRSRLGFKGVIISDDLAMEGAVVAGDITTRARAALGAGCDLLLVCNRPDLVDTLLGTLRWRASAGWKARVKRLFGR
jgi:beta-N-acetylhexosaminidase